MEHMSYSFWIYVLLAGRFWRFFCKCAVCAINLRPPKPNNALNMWRAACVFLEMLLNNN